VEEALAAYRLWALDTVGVSEFELPTGQDTRSVSGRITLGEDISIATTIAVGFALKNTSKGWNHDRGSSTGSAT
jgi:hypothetical protein